jgi:hypothetical protein
VSAAHASLTCSVTYTVISVSTLILMAGDDTLDFAETLRSQIKELLDQINKPSPEPSPPQPGLPQIPNLQRREESGIRELLQRLTTSETRRGLSVQSIMNATDVPVRKWV